MSDQNTSTSSETRVKNSDAMILASQISLLFVLFFVLIYVASSYLQRSTFENLLSFYGPDGPGMYPNVVLPKPFGVHFFGDFLLPHWWSQLDNPWSFSDPSGPPINNYFPFAVLLFSGFSKFAYWKSFLIFFASSLLMLLVPLFRGLRPLSLPNRLQLIVASILLTGPAISLLDRGNIQLLLIGMCLLSVMFHRNGQVHLAAIILGFAIALKGYPAIFLIFFLRERQFKAVFLSVGTSIVLTIGSLSYYSLGIWSGLSLVRRNIELWASSYTRGYLSYNNSIRGSLVSVEALNIPIVSRISSILFSQIGPVTLFLLLLVFLISLNKNASKFEIALVCAALMCGLVDYVAPYAIGIYFIPIYFLWSEGSQVPRKWFISYGWIIAILLAPKGIPVKFWNEGFAFSSPTYTSLLGGICSVLLIVLIAIRTTNRESLREILQLKILRNG